MTTTDRKVGYTKEQSRETYHYYPKGIGTTKPWDELQVEMAKSYDKSVELWDREYMNYRLTCCVCGETFYSRRPTKRYCSLRCRNDAYMVRREYRRRSGRMATTTCSECGSEFIVGSRTSVKGSVHRAASKVRTDAKYCSDACRQKHHRKSLRLEVEQICAKPITVTDGELGQKTKVVLFPSNLPNVTDAGLAEVCGVGGAL